MFLVITQENEAFGAKFIKGGTVRGRQALRAFSSI